MARAILRAVEGSFLSDTYHKASYCYVSPTSCSATGYYSFPFSFNVMLLPAQPSHTKLRGELGVSNLKLGKDICEQ